jgi:hypothetical protein
VPVRCLWYATNRSVWATQGSCAELYLMSVLPNFRERNHCHQPLLLKLSLMIRWNDEVMFYCLLMSNVLCNRTYNFNCILCNLNRLCSYAVVL